MTSLETAVVHAKKLRPRTKELYLQHIRAFLGFIKESKAAGEPFTTENAIAWCADMRARRIKAQSVNVALNALRFAARKAGLKFADDIETLPVRKRRKSEARVQVDRPLRWDEGRRLLEQCHGRNPRELRDAAIIVLGLRTGMLRFSMCQLKFEDLSKSSDDTTLSFVKKGGERHTITLDLVTLYALTSWTDWLRNQDIDSGYIFRSLGRDRVRLRDGISIGDKLTPDGLYRAVQLRARMAKLPDLSPHVFRKTFLAWARKAGARPAQIAAVTGHKSDAVGDDGEPTPPANFLIPDLSEKGP
jgi:integrase